MMGDEIIRKSAALRGLRNFDEAINLIEANINSINPDLRLNAYLEAFKAAIEKGNELQAKKYAKLIANEDPDVPSIQAYL